MNALPTTFPRVPLKQMDPALLWFELDRETHRLMPEDCELITSAATMASFLHREQTRFVRGDMDRVPYIEHPLRVALRLIRWGSRDAELIAAALLHDVAEDCADELLDLFGHVGEGPLDCLARLYGPQVAGLVGRVTNPTACGSADAASRRTYEDHLAALASSGSKALLIKASDLKDNAGSIKYQLGHGKDGRMLRMIAKYLPVVPVVADGLAIVDAQGAAAARVDLGSLLDDLQGLAASHGVQA